MDLFQVTEQVRGSPKATPGAWIPAQPVLRLWLLAISLWMAVQNLLGLQNWASVLLSSTLRSSRGFGRPPGSPLLGLSLPFLSYSFHLTPIGVTSY